MGILSAITAGLKAIAALLGFGETVQKEKNTPSMQANAAAQTDEQAAAKAAADAANPNPENFERDIS